MVDLNSENLSSGEQSRLIPVGKESNREVRTIGPCLATMALIPDLTQALLKDMGASVGVRTKINCFSEVVFNRSKTAAPLKHNRPDGLIVLTNGKKKWRALVEAKVGSNELDQQQVEDYLTLAREQGIDAIVTISNQFTQAKSSSPVSVRKTLLNKVDLFHLSWSNLLTTALIVQEDDRRSGDPMDRDHAKLLDELIRFLMYPETGVSGFNSMNKEWQDFVKSGAESRRLKSAEINKPSVLAWISESQDLALRLSRSIRRRTKVKLRREENDPKTGLDTRVTNLIKEFVEKGTLTTTLTVPNIVSDIKVVADLHAQTCHVSMRVNAPADRKSKGRLSWLHRQLSEVEDQRIQVSSKWRGGGLDPKVPLAEFLADRDVLDAGAKDASPSHFEVELEVPRSRAFESRKKFVEQLEAAVEDFYAKIASQISDPNPVRATKPDPKAPINLGAESN